MTLIADRMRKNAKAVFRKPVTSITQYRQDSIKRNIERKLYSALEATQKDKIELDQLTSEAIREEVSNLLYAAGDSNRRSCKVTEIAMALKKSKAVVELYASADDEKTSDFEGFPSLFNRLKLNDSGGLSTKENRFLGRKYIFFKVMDHLEKKLESIQRNVSSWIEARNALSVVLTFPDESSDNAIADENQSDSITATGAYKQRIALLLQRRTAERVASLPQRLWKKIECQHLPSKIDGRENNNVLNYAVEQVDAKRNETLSAKYEALDTHFDKPEVQALELRRKEKEAEDRASSLMRKLTDEEKAIVEKAIYGNGPPHEVLARIGSDSVQRRSLQLLKPGEWLNDEIIHYFLIVLAKRDEELCRQDTQRKPTHFFKSFFFTKLLNEGDAKKDGVYEYRNVKRWSKNVKGKDIFNLSKIFFPINLSQVHWFCAVAFMQEKRIQIYDSMGSEGRKYLRSIFQYIQDEHLDKKGSPLPDVDEWQLVPTTGDTPAQHNGFDCGVFTCMFADFLSKDCPLVFNQTHITQCRERIALSIMKGSAIL